MLLSWAELGLCCGWKSAGRLREEIGGGSGDERCWAVGVRSRRAPLGLMNVWEQDTERAHIHLWDRHPFDARQTMSRSENKREMTPVEARISNLSHPGGAPKRRVGFGLAHKTVPGRGQPNTRIVVSNPCRISFCPSRLRGPLALGFLATRAGNPGTGSSPADYFARRALRGEIRGKGL